MSEIVPVPVPGEAFGGTSWEPANVTVVVQVGPTVGVAVAVAVFVGVFVDVAVSVGVFVTVAVAVGVNVGVLVAVAVAVGVLPPGIVTLPFVVGAGGSPSPHWNAG